MLVKYMPRNLVSNVNRNLERRGGNYHGFGNMMPNVDISEDRDRIYIQMEVPGYSKDNVNVNLNEGNILAISGESKHREEFEDRKFSKIERRHGKFKRSFALPDRVDSEKNQRKRRERSIGSND
jgi:HSP20 family protein